MPKKASFEDSGVRSLKALPNPEKKNHEKWDANRNPIDWPRPFRWGVLGAVSCGKTSLALNYLINAHKYDHIFLMHPMTYNATVDREREMKNEGVLVDQAPEIGEYIGVDFTALAYIPSMNYFANIAKENNLLIIDDIDLCSYCKKRHDVREERLNKLFSYVSSHHNLSIIVSSQDASSQLPGFVLKMCNVITIYKVKDEYIVNTLARRISVSYKRLLGLMGMCKTRHDAITFDYTDNSPMPLRLNIYDPVEMPELPKAKARKTKAIKESTTTASSE